MARIKKALQQPTEKCFVIMPFGGYFDTYYQEIYCTAIDKAGLLPVRADDLFRSSSIIEDIWRLTKEAKVILADLSFKNPNVFYELGLAHATSKPVILVAQSIDDVPADIRGIRTLIFDKNAPSWGLSLAKRITKAITETLASPQEAIPTTFLNVKDHPKKEISITHEDKVLLEIRKDVESLKRAMMINTAMTSSEPLESSPIHTYIKVAGDRSNPVFVSDKTIRKATRIIAALPNKELTNGTAVRLAKELNVSVSEAVVIIKHILARRDNSSNESI